MPATMDIPSKAVNTAFADKLERGMVHEASVTVTSFIRKKLREESFVSNKILTEQFITNQDLNKDVDLDKIQKIVEIEPDSQAMWISFKGLPEARYLNQGAAIIPFATIVTQEVKKNIIELKTRDNDVRKIISDNHVKDILAQQDSKFIEGCRKIITDFPAQKQVFAGGFSKTNFAEALKKLPSKRIPNGVILMNESTSKEILKWDTNDVGFQPMTEQYTKGLTISELMGLKMLVTIKNDIILDNEVWFFGQEDFLGKFYTLMDSTVYMEKRGLYISFYAYKVLGQAIVNTNSVFLGVFE